MAVNNEAAADILYTDRFTESQVRFLRFVGVRVETGTETQIAYNDRAAKAEARLERLRANLSLIVSLDKNTDEDEWACGLFTDEPLHPGGKNCSGCGWFRCRECSRFSAPCEDPFVRIRRFAEGG